MTAASDNRRASSAAAAAGWWPVALVFLLACLPYVETPWFEFVEYDDPGHVFDNPMVAEGLTPRGVAWAFGIDADPDAPDRYSWPLTWLSHMADVSAFGLWAGGHHVVNVLLHAVNAGLTLALGLRLGLGLPGALLVASVFAVHPVQVESVAWVSERKTVLSACLMLLSLLAYLRWLAAAGGWRAWGWLIGWNTLGLLALLAKPLAVTLPCVLLLLDAVLLGRMSKPWPANIARCVGEKLPLVACAGFAAAWTMASQAEAGAVISLPWSLRLAHAVVAYATYLRVFFWPVDLGCIHPHPGMPGLVTFVAAAAALVAMTAACLGATRGRRPLAVVGWCWFLGTLVPMIGLVTVGSNGWSARYLYFPIIGLAIAVVDVARGLGGPAWAEWQRRRAGSGQPSAIVRSAPALLAGAWLAVLTATAWLQTAQWRDTPTLAARTFAGSTEPHAHWHVWTWRARYHARRGELAAAADSAERAARLAPHHADAWATLAEYQLAAGRAAAALAHASRAIELDPADAAAALTLATAAFQLRDDTAAARAWAGLGELGYTDRDLAIIFHERGVEHLQAGRDAEAAIDFGIAMDRARDHPRAATNLGLALSRLGLFDAAVAAFREALDRDPGNEAARAGLQDAVAKRAAAAPSRASGGPAREGDEAGHGPGEQGGEEEPPRPPLAEE